MEPIVCIDRVSGRPFTEEVFAAKLLKLSLKYRWIQETLARLPLFSSLYACYQKMPWTKRAIAPFVRRFELNPEEFEKKLEEFDSFDDFFIRRLKTESRPLAKTVAVIPADGRYRFFPNWNLADGVFVKGKSFSLQKLLQNQELAARYKEGTVVVGRLAPPDYHRFHFAVSGTPTHAKLIPGSLYSVNPWSLSQRIEILTENKRMVTEIKTPDLGLVTAVEVGATNVGSVHQTYSPQSPVQKGAEKGYFDFGGSLLILLFEKNALHLAPDLEKLSTAPYEIRCLTGQPLSNF